MPEVKSRVSRRNILLSSSPLFLSIPSGAPERPAAPPGKVWICVSTAVWEAFLAAARGLGPGEAWAVADDEKSQKASL